MSQPRRAYTLKDVAAAARMSVSGVSYALRGHPRIPAATVKRIRRIADEIGYRPDLRISSVMAHIRRQRLPRDRETLAFVWVSTPRAARFPAYHQYYLRTILAGAKARAEQLGCALAEFWLDEPGMTPQRLAQILLTRGITGVVFSPAMLDLTVTIDWDWNRFACAIIGNTEWKPALHRAGHHHYRSMWLTLQRLRAEGFTRPAAILNRSIHERIHGVHFAAFQVNHPSSGEVAAFAQFGTPEDLRDLRRWPAKRSPDALIIGWPADKQMTTSLQRYAPRAKRIVTLDWQPGGPPGMDVNNATIASSAIDLVVAQLHRNERGIPANPTSLLLDGIWQEESG